jgi:S-adenosylmethionine-diacylglycerol 3-amino-3-carboxypropyl transferase
MAYETAHMLRQAVHRHSPLSRQGALERMFTMFFDSLVYNQIWEDPRVDLEALRVSDDSRILTIASGGCNILNYLVAGPERVAAVDLNPYHVALAQLKIAALEHLPDYEAFFTFFGRANDVRNVHNYDRFVAPHLEERTRRFWNGRTWRGERRIEYFSRGFYDHARNGYYLRFLHSLAKLLGGDPERLLRTPDPIARERVFESLIAPYFDHWFIKILSKLPFVVFGLGIPPHQYDALRRENAADILAMYRTRVKKLACGFPIEENYFAWQAFGRRYDCEARCAVPEYLKEENYRTLRENVGRASVRNVSLTEFLRRQSHGDFNRFVFLDSQDWMSGDEIGALWREIARVAPSGSRIIFRTAPQASPVEAALTNDVRERFVCERELAAALFERDRAAIYGGFHVYSVK